MSARKDLADLLRPLLPNPAPEGTWSLYDYPKALDSLDPDQVAVIFETWKATPHAIPGRQVTEFTVALVVAATDPEHADDALDDAVIVLIDVLDQVAGRHLVNWTDATRGTYRDQYPAYLVTVTTDTQE